MSKPTNAIPKGSYCYTFVGASNNGYTLRIKQCPYWERNEKYPDQ